MKLTPEQVEALQKLHEDRHAPISTARLNNLLRQGLIVGLTTGGYRVSLKAAKRMALDYGNERGCLFWITDKSKRQLALSQVLTRQGYRVELCQVQGIWVVALADVAATTENRPLKARLTRDYQAYLRELRQRATAVKEAHGVPE